MTYFKKLIEEKDKSILFYHKKKDIKALEIVLSELNKEHTALKENLNEVIYLLTLIDKHPIKTTEKQEELPSKHQKEIEKWLQSLKDLFEGFHNTSTEDLDKEEVDFIKLEKTKLLDEKKNLEHQLKYINNIISKTTVLLTDVRNEFCKKITKGYDIVAVSKKLAEKYGDKVVGTYISGRKEIILFLEKTFKISKIRSKELIDLLEKSNTINFKIDIPENDVFYYYKDYGFADEFVPIIGAWHINV
ncbi:hypothetical protein [Lutibacter sp.]